MQSRQLLASCTQYKSKSVGPSIRSIADRGMMGRDKKVAEMKRKQHEEKSAARSNSADKTAAHFERIANNLSLDNDSSWISQQGAKERELSLKVSRRSFWESVPNKDGFHQKLLRVFPYLAGNDKESYNLPSITPIIPRLFPGLLLPERRYYARSLWRT